VPSLSLPDAKGEPVSVDRLLEKGPVVANFYRGGWCPFCNLALRAWQAQLAELKNLGATLLAISPLTLDNSLSTAEKNKLAFPVLSDSAPAAHGFGIAFTLPPELVDLYSPVGNNLPELNGDGCVGVASARDLCDRHRRCDSVRARGS
jgi:peroxiredoxin